MSTNRERAAVVVGKEMSIWDMDGRPDIEGGIDGHIVGTLAYCGLLAPDLPHPDRTIGGNPWWIIPSDEVPGTINTVFVDHDGIWNEGEWVTPDTARKTALALLAAADHAERAHR